MAQPKSSKSSSKSKSSSSSSKKVAAPATGKKVSRVVAAKSAKSVELVTEKVAALAPEVVVLPEVVVGEVVAEVVELAPVREVSRAEFMELVRKEAYRRAHSRHFRNGSPFQDWVNAEATVSGKLAAEGARLS